MNSKNLKPLILAAVAVFAGHANGATIASANFAGYTAGNVSNPFNPSVTPGENEFTWTTIGPNSAQLSIANADLTSGSGNALGMAGGGTFRALVGTMGSATTIPVGQTLTLSLNGQFTAAPGNSTIRIGFMNSGDFDNAYFMNAGIGTITTFSSARDIGAPGGVDVPGGGDVVAFTNTTTSGPAYAAIGTSTFTASFSITRTAATTYSLAGNVNGSGFTATDTAGNGWDNYSRIFLNNGNQTSSFRIDNVSVTLVPEPSAALLGGLGLLALFRRRRA